MDKTHYSISEAGKLVGVESHVLRYWEDELQIDIPRNGKSHRYYTELHIRLFQKIKELKEKGYQLKAIEQVLKKMIDGDEDVDPDQVLEQNAVNILKEGSAGDEMDDEHTLKTISKQETTAITVNAEKMEQLQAGNRGKIAFYRGYNEALAHRIYAGSDLFFMPSLFEPCGLSQLISMRYGTLPLVRETGGLKDTVQPYNEFEKTGTGFSFANYNSNEMMDVLRLAVDVYYNRREDWKTMVRNAMSLDVSWEKSAYTYCLLYKELHL